MYNSAVLPAILTAALRLKGFQWWGLLWCKEYSAGVCYGVKSTVLGSLKGTPSKRQAVLKMQKIIIIIDHFYIALFSTLEQTHSAHGACDSEWDTVSTFIYFNHTQKKSFLLNHPKLCTDSTVLVVVWQMPCETAAISAQVLCTPYNQLSLLPIMCRYFHLQASFGCSSKLLGCSHAGSLLPNAE